MRESAPSPPPLEVVEMLAYGKPTTPVVGARELTYPHLRILPRTITPVLEAFAEGGETPAAHEIRGQLAQRSLLEEQLLRTAAAMQQGDGPLVQRRWAQEYTRINAALHGVPDEQVAREILANQYHVFKENAAQFREPHRLDAAYRLMELTHTILGQEVPLPETDPRLATIVEQLHPVVMERFAPAIAVLETADDDQIFDAAATVALTRECIQAMATIDPAWESWVAKEAKGSIFSTYGMHHEFWIGDRRKVTGKANKQTIIHELTHAWMDNGTYRAKLDEDLDKISLVLVDTPLEGTALLADKAFTGAVELSPFVHGGSMYLNTALAYGTFSGFPALLRPELAAIMQDRRQARIEINETPDESTKMAAEGAARFYRGTPASGKFDTGVAMWGTAYRSQFLEMIDLTHTLLQGGMAPAEVFDYYMLGNFNMADPTQIAYMAELYERTNDQRAVGLIEKAGSILAR